MQVFKYLIKKDNNGGGGGSRIRLCIYFKNRDSSGFYSISGTWNRSRQNLIPFDFFNMFTKHKTI